MEGEPHSLMSDLNKTAKMSKRVSISFSYHYYYYYYYYYHYYNCCK